MSFPGLMTGEAHPSAQSIRVYLRLSADILIACIVLVLATAASQAADPRKVIRVASPSAEKGFDCVQESDENTGTICDNIFDALLQYDHLARPIKLQPRAAEALPEVTDGGRTFT